jgi:hypothetical protein
MPKKSGKPTCGHACLQRCSEYILNMYTWYCVFDFFAGTSLVQRVKKTVKLQLVTVTSQIGLVSFDAYYILRGVVSFRLKAIPEKKKSRRDTCDTRNPPKSDHQTRPQTCLVQPTKCASLEGGCASVPSNAHSVAPKVVRKP